MLLHHHVWCTQPQLPLHHSGRRHDLVGSIMTAAGQGLHCAAMVCVGVACDAFQCATFISSFAGMSLVGFVPPCRTGASICEHERICNQCVSHGSGVTSTTEVVRQARDYKAHFSTSVPHPCIIDQRKLPACLLVASLFQALCEVTLSGDSSSAGTLHVPPSTALA